LPRGRDGVCYCGPGGADVHVYPSPARIRMPSLELRRHVESDVREAVERVRSSVLDARLRATEASRRAAEEARWRAEALRRALQFRIELEDAATSRAAARTVRASVS
jgi:hypothetical protein